MLFVGDIHIYVSDFARARRFWADGLQLDVAEEQRSAHSAFARLDFPGGGPSLRLIGPVTPWPEDLIGATDTYPNTRFDITTSTFDDTLARLLEHGGRKVSEIESYSTLRAVTLADPDGNLFELLEIDDDAGASAET
jgi:catechol 2,3-dioxygenase-like lactoylglutathione lyase family enzyme